MNYFSMEQLSLLDLLIYNENISSLSSSHNCKNFIGKAVKKAHGKMLKSSEKHFDNSVKMFNAEYAFDIEIQFLEL